MGTINKLNYEAYYLDFLEGNLDDNYVQELLAFLDKNPTLKVDDDLPILDDTAMSLNNNIKQSLKKFDESLEINAETAEDFIIAKNEGILPPATEAELTSSEHFDAQLDKTYQQIKLTPKSSERYIFKESLKKKEAPVRPIFWWSVAASILLIVAFNFPWNSTGIEENNGFTAKTSNDRDSISPKRKVNTTLPFTIEKDQVKTAVVEKPTARKKPVLPPKTNEQKKEEKNNPKKGIEQKGKPEMKPEIPSVKNQPVPVFENNPFEVSPIAKNTYSQEEQPVNEQDLASVSAKKMVNPIQPITNFITEKTSIDIDYQHSEKNENSKRSFKLKIGKFSITRKRK